MTTNHSNKANQPTQFRGVSFVANATNLTRYIFRLICDIKRTVLADFSR
jgi:hypothetical protein